MAMGRDAYVPMVVGDEINNPNIKDLEAENPIVWHVATNYWNWHWHRESGLGDICGPRTSGLAALSRRFQNA